MKIEKFILIISFCIINGSCEDINLNKLAKFKEKIFGQYQTLKANYKKLTEENKKLRHEVNILQDNLEETKAQNDNLNDALETLEAASVTEIKLLQDNLEEAKAQNDNLNDAL